jgi:anti-anti-sigma regulatory factor
MSTLHGQRLERARELEAPAEFSGEVRLYSGRQLVVTRTQAPDGLRFAGEIDATNVADVDHALRSFHSTGPLHLDLSTLLFCDVSGIRAMVKYAQGLDGDRRLRLHGLPDQIEKVLNIVGWGELPGLEFCSCEMSS